MPERKVFRLTSGEGYGAVVNGNFVRVVIGLGGFYVSVYAFLSDDTSLFQVFDNAADAVKWGVETAKNHQGKSREKFPVAHWEIRHGYSLTVSLEDSGEYEGEIFPLWYDSHPDPLRNFKRWPTRDEAIQWAREAADEAARQDDDYQSRRRQIRDALAEQAE